MSLKIFSITVNFGVRMVDGEVKGNLKELQILINLIDENLKMSYTLYPSFEMIRADPEAEGYR